MSIEGEEGVRRRRIQDMTKTSTILRIVGLALALLCTLAGTSEAAEEEQRRKTEGVELTVAIEFFLQSTFFNGLLGKRTL